jgi:hypothetical protein
VPSGVLNIILCAIAAVVAACGIVAVLSYMSGYYFGKGKYAAMLEVMEQEDKEFQRDKRSRQRRQA